MLITIPPDGPPYSNVTSIRQRVAVLSKLIDVNLTKDKHGSLREVNDVTGYMRTILDTNRCRALWFSNGREAMYIIKL